MDTLANYIKKHEIKPLISQKRHQLLPGIIVVIPCYNELDIIKTLLSLIKCENAGCRTEVIVVVNSGESDPENILEQNQSTYLALLDFKERYNTDVLAFYPMMVKNIRNKHAGVGMARKTGMDQAVLRFFENKQSNGIIVSLDADTHVKRNYLKEIRQQFISEKLDLATIAFEHPTHGSEHDSIIYEGITRYELHLRYTKLAIAITGFPHSIHTLGSAFAVRAGVYAMHGGMNRKKGGEDFYFLHKILPHVRFKEIYETRVYPSPRPSDRVPFGTGPQMDQWCLNQQMLSYDFQSFLDLREFLSRVDELFSLGNSGFSKLINQLPESVRDFLEGDNFAEKIAEVFANASSFLTFRKRFFQYFNAFKVVKFLNFSHQTYYDKKPVEDMCRFLLEFYGISNQPLDAKSMLLKLRDIETHLSKS